MPLQPTDFLEFPIPEVPDLNASWGLEWGTDLLYMLFLVLLLLKLSILF